MLLRQSAIKWNQFKPWGKWVVVKADPEQTVTSGGIFLTEIRPQAADVGFFTGTVLKEGREVAEIAGSSLVGSRIIHRQYLSDVIRFKDKHEDGSSVFIIEVSNIEGTIAEGVKIDAI